MKLYTRKVLLSTGEFTIEAVIRIGDKEFYGTAPLGLTVGLKEKQSDNINYANKSCIKKLNLYKDIDKLSLEKFDKLVSKTCDSQTATALSLAYLKYIAHKDKFDDSKIFQFIGKKFQKQPRAPQIIANILNGGKHSNNKLAFCEFMIIPQSDNVEESVKIASEVYLDLKNIIKDKLGETHLYIGREGGLSPLISDIGLAISLIKEAIAKRNAGKCKIAIDVAANNFSKLSKNGKYIYNVDDKKYTTDQLIKYYSQLIDKFPEIIYLEDPLHENDLAGWKKMKKVLGHKILIVADDLTNSTLYYIKKYAKNFNACILKFNQAGNINKLIAAYEFCIKNNIKTIISQRSGEVDSNIISHLAVGLASNYLKAGAPARERIIKYNELIRISYKIDETK